MNTLSNIIPNPLLINKILNSDYSISKFATSDFDGKENTAVLRKYNDNIIPNRLPENMFVGSIGEIGLIMENISYINNIIRQFNGNEISLNAKYASSTFYNENTINLKEYNISNDINEIWYYNTYNGMISKDKITSTFNSLPIYKYDITDFNYDENYYSEDPVNRIYLLNKEGSRFVPFDLCSYIIYCQDDTLDDLENTLSTYYFKEIQNTTIEDIYIKLNPAEAFSTSRKQMNIAPQSFDFGKSCIVNQKELNYSNISEIYVKEKDQTSNSYYKIEKIINNTLSIDTDVYLNYNENDTSASIDINYKYNNDNQIRIKKTVNIISPEDYQNIDLSKSQNSFLICIDTDVNVLKAHFVNINNTPDEITDLTHDITYYEDFYKKESVTITNKNNIIDNVIPFNIKYIIEENNVYKWIDFNDINHNTRYTSSNINVINFNDNTNELEIRGNGQTVVTVSFGGGKIDDSAEYYEPFEISCVFNIDIPQNEDSPILENFARILYNNGNIISISDIDSTENTLSISNANINDFAFIITNNDNNEIIFPIIKIENDNIYEFNNIESIDNIYSIYKVYNNNGDLIKFYSFVKNANNEVIEIGCFVRQQENEMYTNKYKYNKGFYIEDNKDEIIRNLINGFLEFNISDSDNNISNDVIKSITFNSIDVIDNKIVIPFTIDLNYINTDEYTNGSARLKAYYKYFFPSGDYQIHEIILLIDVIQGYTLNNSEFRFDINTNDPIVLEEDNNELPTLVINSSRILNIDDFKEKIHFEAEAYKITDKINNTKEILENIYVSFTDNWDIVALNNTPKDDDFNLVIKAVFEGNNEFKLAEASYNLIVNLADLEILELEYNANYSYESNKNEFRMYRDADINSESNVLGMKRRSFVFKSGDRSYKKAKFKFIEYDFSYYIYFTVNGRKYLLETNNERVNEFIASTGNNPNDPEDKLETISVFIVDGNDIKEIVFYINKYYKYGSIYIETGNNSKNNIYRKSIQYVDVNSLTNMTSINKESIIKYPIYISDKSVYSIPLLPSKKIGNYYNCEFFIILPTIYINRKLKKYIKNDNTGEFEEHVINDYTGYSIDNIYDNIVIILKFGDNEIKEVLKPYKKCNDVVIYKFNKVDLFDYTFVQNQELKIFVIDYGESINVNNSNNSINNRIILYQKMFFNIFKFNLQQGKYQNIDFKIKYKNYYPLKYPIKKTKQRYLELNYIPLEKLSEYDPNTLSDVNINKTTSLTDVIIDLDNLAFNYSYLNTYNYKNISETNDILSWFLGDNGNGLNIGISNLAIDNTYTTLTLTLENIVGNKYNMKGFNDYIYYKNYTYYDEFGILSGIDDLLDIKSVEGYYNDKTNEMSLNFPVYGMKEIIYTPYLFDVSKYGNTFGFSNLTGKISIFEDILYIYNMSDEEVSIYFTDESHVLCESTRNIELLPNEIRLYKPSRHTDYNIIIKMHSIDNYILKYASFDYDDIINVNNIKNNIVSHSSKPYQTINKNNISSILENSRKSDYDDIVTIHISEYHIAKCGHIVTIEKKQ